MASQPETIAFTGIVTKNQEDFGMVRDDVFFVKSVVKGPFPDVGDRVLVQAERVHGMPFKYVAKRLQRLFKDVNSTTDVSNSAIQPQSTYYSSTSTNPTYFPKENLESCSLVKPSYLVDTDVNERFVPEEEPSALSSEYEAFEASINAKDIIYENDCFGHGRISNSKNLKDFSAWEERRPSQYAPVERTNYEDSRMLKNDIRFGEGGIINSNHYSNHLHDEESFFQVNPSESTASRQLERPDAQSLYLYSNHGSLYSQNGEIFERAQQKKQAEVQGSKNVKVVSDKRPEDRKSSTYMKDQDRAVQEENSSQRRESVPDERIFFRGPSKLPMELSKQQKEKMSRFYCNKYGQEQCFICGSTDHKIKKCPQRPETTDKDTKKGSSGKGKEKVDSKTKHWDKSEKADSRNKLWDRPEKDDSKNKHWERSEKDSKNKHWDKSEKEDSRNKLWDRSEKEDFKNKHWDKSEKEDSKNKHWDKSEKEDSKNKHWDKSEKEDSKSKHWDKSKASSISVDCVEKTSSSGKEEARGVDYTNDAMDIEELEEEVAPVKEEPKIKKPQIKSLSIKKDPKKNEKLQTFIRINEKRRSRFAAASTSQSSTPTADIKNSQEALVCPKCQKTGHTEQFCLFERITKLCPPVQEPIVKNPVIISSSLNQVAILPQSKEQAPTVFQKPALNPIFAQPPPQILLLPSESLFCTKCQKPGHIEQFCVFKNIQTNCPPSQMPTIQNPPINPVSSNQNQSWSTSNDFNKAWENETLWNPKLSFPPSQTFHPPNDVPVCNLCQKTGHNEVNCHSKYDAFGKPVKLPLIKIPPIIDRILAKQYNYQKSESEANHCSSVGRPPMQSLMQMDVSQKVPRNSWNHNREILQSTNKGQRPSFENNRVNSSSKYSTPQRKEEETPKDFQKMPKKSLLATPLQNNRPGIKATPKEVVCDTKKASGQIVNKNPLVENKMTEMLPPVNSIVLKKRRWNPSLQAYETNTPKEIKKDSISNKVQKADHVSKICPPIEKPAVLTPQAVKNIIEKAHLESQSFQKTENTSKNSPSVEKPAVVTPQTDKNVIEKGRLDSQSIQKDNVSKIIPPVKNPVIVNSPKNSSSKSESEKPTVSKKICEKQFMKPQSSNSPKKSEPVKKDGPAGYKSHSTGYTTKRVRQVEYLLSESPDRNPPSKSHQTFHTSHDNYDCEGDFNFKGPRKEERSSKFPTKGANGALTLTSGITINLDPPIKERSTDVPPREDRDSYNDDLTEELRPTDVYRSTSGHPVCYKCKKIGHVAKFCGSQTTSTVNPDLEGLMDIEDPKLSHRSKDISPAPRKDFDDYNKTETNAFHPTPEPPQSKCRGCAIIMTGGIARGHSQNCLLGKNPRFDAKRKREENSRNRYNEQDHCESNYKSHRLRPQMEERHPVFHEQDHYGYERNYDLEGQRADEQMFPMPEESEAFSLSSGLKIYPRPRETDVYLTSTGIKVNFQGHPIEEPPPSFNPDFEERPPMFPNNGRTRAVTLSSGRKINFQGHSIEEPLFNPDFEEHPPMKHPSTKGETRKVTLLTSGLKINFQGNPIEEPPPNFNPHYKNDRRSDKDQRGQYDSGRRSPVLLIARNKEDIPTAHHQNRQRKRPFRPESSHFPETFDHPDFNDYYEEPPHFSESFDAPPEFYEEEYYPEPFDPRNEYDQGPGEPPYCDHCDKMGHFTQDCRRLKSELKRRRHMVIL